MWDLSGSEVKTELTGTLWGRLSDQKVDSSSWFSRESLVKVESLEKEKDEEGC